MINLRLVTSVYILRLIDFSKIGVKPFRNARKSCNEIIFLLKETFGFYLQRQIFQKDNYINQPWK